MSHARAYYNENDPFAAQWLRNLITAGHIAAGDVDERSIVDVSPGDLAGYRQCHFFAGIAGWSYALRLAGWPDDRPVWTGSCPCQDFSIVGKQAGIGGSRDLWPAWFPLIRQWHPDNLFGEQVDRAPEWTDRTATDLESIGYACGQIVIPAVAVGAPHERARVYFVADADAARWEDTRWVAAAKARASLRASVGMVRCQAPEHFQRTFKPDDSWVVDGLSGEGFTIGAYGNAIVPQVAAEFIGAFLDSERG